MAKWYGKVGYIMQEEVRPGVWGPTPTERIYYGDLLSGMSKWSSSATVNDNLNVANKISIMADPFANQHFSHIKYVEFMGAMWNVTSVEPQPPRLILTVGGVYNGQTTAVAE